MKFYKSKYYFYLINIIKLILTLLIQLSDSNRIKNYHSKISPIIHARIGETINISCWFDPNLVMLTHNSKLMRLDDSNDFNINKDTSLLSFRLDYDYKRRKRKRSTELNTAIRKQNQRFHHRNHKIRQLDDTKDLFQANQKLNNDEDDDDETFKIDTSYNNNNNNNNLNTNSQNDNSNSEPAVNKYELDWFFLDKNGHMNIISYGNETKSRHKYKTFLSKEEISDMLSNINSNNNLNQLPYSSSALYSQASSKSNSNTKYINTYYLSVLVESEDDEGVYQCINPDLPNFILRNVTVLLSSNGSSCLTFGFNIKFILILILFINSLRFLS